MPKYYVDSSGLKVILQANSMDEACQFALKKIIREKKV
jgi:hypothetical protein